MPKEMTSDDSRAPGTIDSVCVYCSASAKVSKQLMDMAWGFGKLLAKENVRLVYGGSRVGLMGAVADGCLENEGSVYGVTTDHLYKYETAHTALQKLDVVPDMHTRKARMFEASDGIVVLPGGFGTLDETIEVLTWKQIGLHGKPIIVLNYEGFWDPLHALIHKLVEAKCASESDADLLHFVTQPEEVLPLMRRLPTSNIDPTTKWL